jgi:hypothetical protein
MDIAPLLLLRRDGSFRLGAGHFQRSRRAGNCVNPAHFRPSSVDHKLSQRSSGSQVRVDWFQNQPIMNLVAPMEWSGLAAWSPGHTDPTISTRKLAPKGTA